jgi:hypothetical protein
MDVLTGPGAASVNTVLACAVREQTRLLRADAR